jgi:hypothetical protein
MCENFTELQYKTAEGTTVFQCSLHLCQQPSSTFEQEHVFPPTKSWSPSSAAIGTRNSAMPHHWHNGVLIGFLSKDQTGDTLTVQGQDCSLDVVTVHPKFVRPLAHTFVCSLALP